MPTSSCVCRTDASWINDNQAGLGIYFSYSDDHNNWSLHIQAKSFIASSAFHAESLSLLLAMFICEILQIKECAFLSDCLPLINYLQDSKQDVPDWRSLHALKDIQRLLNQLQGRLAHIPRIENAIAHALATNAIRYDGRIHNFSCSNFRHNEGCILKGKFVIRRFGINYVMFHAYNRNPGLLKAV